MLVRPRPNFRDLAACIPLACLGALLLFVGLAYFQVGHWPQYSRPDPKEVGFEVYRGLRVGYFVPPFIFLIATPLSLLAFVGVFFAALNDLADSQRRRARRSALRGWIQTGVSVAGLVTFFCVLGPLMNWLLD